MSVSAEMLAELIGEAERERVEAEAELQRLTEKIAMLRSEEDAFRSALARRTPTVSPEPSATTKRRPFDPSKIEIRDIPGWVMMSRTDAVELAIREILKTAESASPGEIEQTLAANGRHDDRDKIGGALSYLRRENRIHRLGRGQWAMGPEETSGDAVGAASPESVTTERAGGEADETAPPVEIQDHDDSDRGNTRDLDWENPVAI
jgi:hypothetical protein